MNRVEGSRAIRSPPDTLLLRSKTSGLRWAPAWGTVAFHGCQVAFGRTISRVASLGQLSAYMSAQVQSDAVLNIAGGPDVVRLEAGVVPAAIAAFDDANGLSRSS